MSPRPAVAIRLLLALGILLAVVACGGLLGCSSGDPVSATGLPEGDNTYLIATVTLLDAQDPCTPLTCDPEWVSCNDRIPYLFMDSGGNPTTWEIVCDEVSVGWSGTPSQATIRIRGTDRLTRRSIGLSVDLWLSTDPTCGPCPRMDFRTDTQLTFVDLEDECQDFSANGVKASLFNSFLSSPMDNLTYDEFTAVGEDLVTAEPGGGIGQFSPEGIVGGSFSFVAGNQQRVSGNALNAQVLVEGCFRLNIPRLTQSVPVTRNPSSPGLGCP